MAKRGLRVDHTTIWRWTQTNAPETQRRLQGRLKPKRSTWHMDETLVRIAGCWMCLFRAVDSRGHFFLSETRDREAARCFLKRALANPDNRPRMYSPGTDCEAIPQRSESCRAKVNSAVPVVIASPATQTTASNPITGTSNEGSVRCRVCGRRRPLARSLRESRRCR